MKCSICLGKAKAGEEIASTKCGHCFHRICIVRSLLNNKKCPVCRKPSDRESLQKLYIDFDPETSDSETVVDKNVLSVEQVSAMTNIQSLKKLERENLSLKTEITGLKREKEDQQRRNDMHSRFQTQNTFRESSEEIQSSSNFGHLHYHHRHSCYSNDNNNIVSHACHHHQGSFRSHVGDENNNFEHGYSAYINRIPFRLAHQYRAGYRTDRAHWYID